MDPDDPKLFQMTRLGSAFCALVTGYLCLQGHLGYAQLWAIITGVWGGAALAEHDRLKARRQEP